MLNLKSVSQIIAVVALLGLLPLKAQEWNLVFDENFESYDSLMLKWHRLYAKDRKGTQNDAIPSRVKIDSANGELVLEIVETPTGLEYGYLFSRKSFKYGRFEIKAKMPKHPGHHSSLWLLANDWNKKGWNVIEFDILEYMNTETSRNRIETTTWFNYDPPKSRKQYTHLENPEDYHVYTFIWSPKSIVLLIDGVAVKTFEHDKYQFREKADFRITLEGDNVKKWEGIWDSANGPDEMRVDYFRVYEMDWFEYEKVRQAGQLSSIFKLPEYKRALDPAVYIARRDSLILEDAKKATFYYKTKSQKSSIKFKFK